MNFKKGTKKWVLKIGAYKRVLKNGTYIKIASSNTSRLEAHVDFFQIAYEGDFQSLCTVTFCFDKKLIFKLVMRIRTRDYTVRGIQKYFNPL